MPSLLIRKEPRRSSPTSKSIPSRSPTLRKRMMTKRHSLLMIFMPSSTLLLMLMSLSLHTEVVEDVAEDPDVTMMKRMKKMMTSSSTSGLASMRILRASMAKMMMMRKTRMTTKMRTKMRMTKMRTTKMTRIWKTTSFSLSMHKRTLRSHGGAYSSSEHQ